jgi:hypothetical protein
MSPLLMSECKWLPCKFPGNDSSLNLFLFRVNNIKYLKTVQRRNSVQTRKYRIYLNTKFNIIFASDTLQGTVCLVINFTSIQLGFV